MADIPSDFKNVVQPSGNNFNTPWYCNGSFISGWLGCTDADYGFTKQSQLDAMAGNFGPGIDPSLRDKAIAEFGGYLDSSGFENEIQKKKESDSFDWQTLLVGVVVVGVVMRLVGRR